MTENSTKPSDAAPPLDADTGSLPSSHGPGATSLVSPAGPAALPDVAALRLSQRFQDEIGVKKALVTVPVRKPDKQWWIRTHPDEAWRLDTAILELKDDRETYLVAPDLWDLVSAEVVPKVLLTSVNRQGVVFLWPIRLPSPDGRIDDWNRSALEAATRAQRGWVRISANMTAGSYDVFETSGEFSEPVWPDLSFQSLLAIAFKGKYITTPDHPVLRRLRGEI